MVEYSDFIERLEGTYIETFTFTGRNGLEQEGKRFVFGENGQKKRRRALEVFNELGVRDLQNLEGLEDMVQETYGEPVL